MKVSLLLVQQINASYVGNARESMREWLSNVAVFAPDRTFHNRTVVSHEAEASCFPSGENTTEVTSSEWPWNIAVLAPDFAIHNRTVLSRELEASCFPSGENTTEVTTV
jgi:hypothetical protein